MSKAKSKKSARDDVKGKPKEMAEDKKAETNDNGEAKQSPVKEWSDWKWDEGLKVYYRAKPANGDEWTYEYHYPEVDLEIRELEFPKVEEEVLFIDTRYNIGGLGLTSRTSDPGEGSKAVAEDTGEKAAGKVEGGDEREGKRMNLDKSVDDGRGSGEVKKQQKDGRVRKKDRENHHERKESRYKERRK